MRHIPRRKKPLFERLRVQIAAMFLTQAFASCLALPWGRGLSGVSVFLAYNPHFYSTVILFGIAAAVGLWGVKQIAEYPGTSVVRYYIPALFMSYALAALFALAFRIEYIRPAVLFSFLGSLLWLHSHYFFALRGRKPHVAVIPGGNLRGLEQFSSIVVTKLREIADHTTDFNMIVADLRHDHSAEWERYIARCVLAGIPVHDAKGVIENLNGKVEFEHLSENSFGSVLPSNGYLKLKYITDLIISLMVLPLALLTIFVAGVLIFFESGRPIFFRQERMGYRGVPFSMLKLRTMYHGSAGSRFTKDGDDRITPIGRILRKYRIDELPQIWNIIKGEMSWIGPRPEAVELSTWYDKEIPFYIYRHAVRPGITGWAQVNQGNVAEIEAATEKLRYDFYYIKNFSPWLDILIAAKTIQTVAFGFGSK